MAVFKCRICGFIYDEEKEGIPVSALKECPVCRQSPDNLELVEGDQKAEAPQAAENGEKAEGEEALSLEYDRTLVRHDPACRYMDEIHQMAVTGKTIGGSMGTQMKMPGWDDILILGAQLNPMPLDDGEPVNTMTVIGKHAKKPMILSTPVYISHMSFGALSKEIKVALSKGSAMAKTAMCSGEGGILPEEKAAAYRYIFEYVPNQYSVTRENLRSSDAIEIKIGQGTKPGMGGHLPGEKVTPAIAAIRNKPVGQDVQSPSKFPDIRTKDDLKDLVSRLRAESDGRPIGIRSRPEGSREIWNFAYTRSRILSLSTAGAAPQGPARCF